jgi:hypothetical protein
MKKNFTTRSLIPTLKSSLLVCSVLFFGASLNLNSQTTYTFSTCGATGQSGPTQAQANTFYASTNLNGLVTVTAGIQSWTVPTSGNYRIETNGAQGGHSIYNGGLGSRMIGDFNLLSGQVLTIVVGQKGLNESGDINRSGGGGGGTFIYSGPTLYIASGGGGGKTGYSNGSYNFISVNANSSTTGNAGSGWSIGTGGLGGSSGSGGSGSIYGGGGAGWLSDGGDASSYSGNQQGFSQSGLWLGGSAPGGGGNGGFGGGGAGGVAYGGGGGGGGYSGGGGGTDPGSGGGGGSYNSGTNQTNTSSVTTGDGYAIITRLSGVTIAQTAFVTCNGLSNAVLTASASGGTAPYSYMWSPGGSTSQTLSGVGAGTYTCIATDAASVSYTSSLIVAEPPVLSSAITSQTNLTCNGASNGQIAVSAFGGTPPYTYSWSPSGGTAATATGLSAGTYISYVRDSKNCLSAQIATITQPGPTTVLAFATSPTVCFGQTSILIGAGALTYTWTNGVTNGLPFVPSSSTVYTLTGTNASGCNGTATVAIQVNALPVLTISGSSIICSGSSTTLSAGGANTFTWNNSSNSNSISISPLTTTSYTVSGTNSSGCENSTVKTVTVLNTSPLVTANTSSSSICIGNTTTLFGGGASSYIWSGGVTNNVPFSPGVSGTYTVTGFNACGSGTNSILITVNNLPLITANASSTVVCIGSPAVLSGGGGVSYIWTSGVTNASSFFPSVTATYTVTGTDVNGCQNTASKSILVNSLPIVIANVSNSIVCLGNTTTLFGGGALTYTWSNSVTNNVAFAPSVTNLYVVTGTDANGCQNTASKTVTVINVPALIATATNPSVCQGNPTTLSGSGAISYTWTGGVVNNVAFIPTSTTTYTLYGSNSCGTTSNVITVTVNTLPNVTANASSSVACFGAPITLFGGGANTYTWSGGITNNVAFIPSVTSTYVVTGTNLNGCQNSAVKTLTVLSLPVVTASASSSSFCFGNSTILNGGGASTYSWSGGVLNNTAFIPSLTSAYTVTGTAANGCQNTAVKTITVNPLPMVIANVSNSVICSSNSTSFFGSGANSYTWSGGITNGAILFPTATSTYSVAGTNTLTGCTSTNIAFASVTVNPLPSLTITPSSASVCVGQTVSLLASGANTYTWSGIVQNGVPFTPNATAGYFVTGRNSSTGCSNIAFQTIAVNSLPTVSAFINTSSICGGSSVIFTGFGANTYTWTGGVIDGVPFFPTSSMSSFVVGTNTLTGCTSTNTAGQNVTVNQAPTLLITITNTAVCEGTTVTINSQGANTYSWSNGIVNGVPFTPSVTSTYTLVGLNIASGCTATATRSVVVNPLPIVSSISSASSVCAGNTVTLTASGATTYTWSGGILNGVAFIPLTTTTYSVKGKNTLTGCTSTNSALQTISVNPLPVVSSSITTTSVCFGNPITLFGQGADIYIWTNGPLDGIPFVPLQTDTFYVSGTNTLTGCTSTNVSAQSVLVLTLTPISATSTNSLICSGETSTLSAIGLGTFTWSTGQRLRTIIVTPTVTTNYTVSVIGAFGCVNTATITQNVSDCTSLNEYKATSGSFLSIYPNPSNGSITIQGINDITLTISNSLGQSIKTISLNNTNEQTVILSDLPVGIYFVTGQHNKSLISHKIIITR